MLNTIQERLKSLLKIIRKDRRDESLDPKPENHRGSLLSALLQKKIAAKQPKIELAGVIVERNYWSLTTIILSVALLITIIGYYHQTEKYENNMRTLIIKMNSNGDYQINKVHFDKMPSYFLTTLNSLMSHYVERRFSSLSDSITADYGFAYQFMSEKMRNQFMNEYHAATVAKKFQSCTDCTQVSVKVGVIQHYEDEKVILHAKPSHQYRTTVYATFVKRGLDGSLVGKERKIIELVWRIRTLAQLNNHISSLRADPIGLVMMRESVKTDPSSLNEVKH